MDVVASRIARSHQMLVPPVYFAASALAVGLSRFGGGVACIWIAAAVLLASLMTMPTRRWPALAIACAAAGGIATGCWGIGWRGAPVLSIVSVSEPLIAAWLIRRWRVERAGLDSLPSLARFAVAVGIVAPALTALPAAVAVSAFTGTPFMANLARWFVAHGLGALTFTPVFALVANGEVARALRSLRRSAALEALVLIALVAATALAVFAQSTLPLLFLPVLPLMILTFRQGHIGAALAVVLIALIGGGYTLAGLGPIALLHGSGAAHIQFFQFYLLVTVASVLPVAADLTRRAVVCERLRDSEARFRLLTEHSSDVVLNLDVDGTIRYASPSIARLGGYDPEAMTGRDSSDLIAPEDRAHVRAVHIQALRNPGRTFVVEFRGIVAGDAGRWFETHTQAVSDSDGTVVGVVSAIREISERKRTEGALVQAALTDPLTGLANRRAFDARLATMIAEGPSPHAGCVAMFDLDHFKRVNDTHGHGVGDRVLQAFAAAAQAQTRSGDMLARIGGEEFGLLFPAISIEIAASACERIRLAVAAMEVRAGDWPVRVTVSIGIAPIAHDGAAAAILGAADAALYRAKEAGRNRASRAA